MLGQAISHYRIPVAGARGRNRRQEPLLMLQGAKEIQDVLLLRRAERVEIVDYPVGLRATFRGVEAIVISIRDFAITVGMRLDGLQYIGGASVMQEKQTLAEAPQWCSAELIRTRRPLVDTVRQTRAHVMEGKIGERAIGHPAHAREDRSTCSERG